MHLTIVYSRGVNKGRRVENKPALPSWAFLQVSTQMERKQETEILEWTIVSVLGVVTVSPGLGRVTVSGCYGLLSLNSCNPTTSLNHNIHSLKHIIIKKVRVQ